MLAFTLAYSGRSRSNEARKSIAELRVRHGPGAKCRDLNELTDPLAIVHFDAISFLVCLAETDTQRYKPASLVGAWLSPVEHCVRDAGVAGSNPAAPTILRVTSHAFPDFTSCLLRWPSVA
ncbi:hypothetical protein S58_54660 [Bradyrhizobium oligotrophicum S58]|uniref:Uncharacterized protein n=1 Tax=Bradyrhizobium oligotrophicum S58 TaxID=1245469 RepID=M4ZCD5_9BRAD|nr:hypothetical protein S58_54660 [Bradyrhizobium oligotrophicum S58]